MFIHINLSVHTRMDSLKSTTLMTKRFKFGLSTAASFVDLLMELVKFMALFFYCWLVWISFD